MGKQKTVRKFGAVKRLLNPNDARLYVQATDRSKANTEKAVADAKKVDEKKKRVELAASSMFFQHNSALGPPYRILVDTNFINFSLQNKIELVQGMMDCLYAKCTCGAAYPGIPCITTCVISELEKLGPKYRIALRVARDPRFERLECTHKGTYADDCIIERIKSHKCYIVATCDRELRRRVRLVPGIPLMYIARRQFRIERLPDQGAPS